jgi:hypothetical protein
MLALGLLALVAELAGRSLTHRIDVGRHVTAPSYAHTDYYPVLLAFVKVAIALMLARVVWRFARARAAARAARRVADALGAAARAPAAPRVRLELSVRLWLVSFLVTSLIYLVQTDAEVLAAGRWPLLAPWLHTSALPVFAVLAVLVALVYGVVARWLADYERYAAAALAAVRRRLRAASLPPAPRRNAQTEAPPRRLHGIAFESRPPPAPA